MDVIVLPCISLFSSDAAMPQSQVAHRCGTMNDILDSRPAIPRLLKDRSLRTSIMDARKHPTEIFILASSFTWFLPSVLQIIPQ